MDQDPFKRQQTNQQQALDFAMILTNAPEAKDSALVNQREKLNKDFVQSQDLTKALAILHEMKDARSNIANYISDPNEDGTKTRVRDARKAIKPPINAPEIFAIQIINHARAAINVAKDNLSNDEFKTIEAEITKIAFAEAQNILTKSADKTNNDFAVSKQEKKGSWSQLLKRDVTNFNTVLYDKLTTLGVKNCQRQLQDAKDYANFSDEHYHIATIYNVKDGHGLPTSQIELNIMNLGLSKEQQKIFQDINKCVIPEKPDEKMQVKDLDWFNNLELWQQKQLKNAAPIILKENKVCPTQLNFLPLPKNFYSKHTYVAYPGEKPELCVSTMHSGTPTAMAGSSFANKLTNIVINSIRAFTKDGKITINSLTTPFTYSKLVKKLLASSNPIEINEPKHIASAFPTSDKVSKTITPLNIGRLLKKGGGRDLEAFSLDLAKIGKNLPDSYGAIKVYLESYGSKVTHKQALEALTLMKNNIDQDPEFYQGLTRIIETKNYINSFQKKFNPQTGLLDRDNIHAQIISNMEIITSQVNQTDDKNNKVTSLGKMMKDLTLNSILTHCKSGKDRTGEEQTLTSFNAATEKLNVKENSKIWQDNLENQLAAGHTNTLAGCGQGGTHGCFGIQIPSAKDAPKKVFGKYINWIGQISAKMNKFEVKSEFSSLSKVKHVVTKLKKISKIKFPSTKKKIADNKAIELKNNKNQVRL